MGFLGQVFLILIALSGCSTTQDAKEQNVDDDEFSLNEPDPLELFNRYIYGFNRIFDTTIIRPVAIAYELGTPENVKYCTKSFIQNAYSPINLVNHLLQGKMENAAKTTLRFALNTTFGLFGLIDFAEFIGINAERTNCNETLASWGVEPGPYLMLPIIGPTTFRGAYGYAFDWLADPLRIFATYSTSCLNRHHQVSSWYWWVTALDVISIRAELLDILDDIYKSPDSYVTLRSIIFQRQQKVDNQLKKDKADD